MSDDAKFTSALAAFLLVVGASCWVAWSAKSDVTVLSARLGNYEPRIGRLESLALTSIASREANEGGRVLLESAPYLKAVKSPEAVRAKVAEDGGSCLWELWDFPTDAGRSDWYSPYRLDYGWDDCAKKLYLYK